MSRDLVCREVVELINGYIDDALPADVRSAVAAHLTGCDGCTTVLEEFHRTIELTGMLTEADVTPAQREVLLAAFRGWAFG